MKNKTRKKQSPRMNKNLQESSHLFRIVAQRTGLLIYEFDLETKQINWDGDVEKITGYSGKEFGAINLEHWKKMIHPDDWNHYLNKLENADQTIGSYTLEYRFRRKDGVYIFLQDNSTFVPNKEGKAGRLIGILQDITLQKKTKKRYIDIFENAVEGIFQTTPEGKYIKVNPAYARIFGYQSATELIETVTDISNQIYVNPEQRNFFKQTLQDQGSIEEFVCQNYRKDKSIIWTISNARAVLNEQGQIQYYEGFTQDITARMETEKALRESERRFRNIFEKVNLISVTLDNKGNITFANDYLLQVTGWEHDQLVGKNWFDTCLPPDVHDSVKKYFYEFIATDTFPSYFKNEIQTRSGERRQILWNNITFYDPSGNQVIGTASIGEDITERELAQEERERLIAILESTSDMVSIATPDHKFIYMNQAGLDMLGWSEGDLPTHTIPEAHPSWAIQTIKEEAIPAAIKHNIWQGETAILDKEGVEKSVSQVILAHRDPNGLLQYLSTTIRDISRIKNAENQLLEREYWLSESQRVSHLGTYRLDIRTGVWEGTEALDEIFGIDSAFPKTVENWIGIVHPEERDQMLQYFQDEVIGAKKPFDREYRIQNFSDQQIRWVHGRGKLIQNKKGEPIVMIGTIQDITERKQSATALQKSEEELKSIFRAAPIGIGVAVNRYLKAGNERLCKMLGYAWDELKDQSARILYPSDKEYTFVGEEKYRQIAEKGTGTVETKWVHKDGSIIQVLLSSTPIDASDTSKGITFTALDITERKQAQEKLQARSSEIESLFTIATTLRSAKSSDEMLPLILNEMSRVLDSDADAVIILGTDQKNSTIALADGLLEKSTGYVIRDNQGNYRTVLESQYPIIAEDSLSNPDPHWPSNEEVQKLGPELIAPLLSDNEILGAICAYRKKGRPNFTSNDVRLLSALGEMVGNALRKTQLYDQALERLTRIQALRNIDLAITASIDPRVTLDILLGEIVSQLKIDAADVLLFSQRTLMLEFTAGYGIKSENRKPLRFGDGIAGRIASERRTLQIPDLSQARSMLAPQELQTSREFTTYCGTPMVVKGQIIGVLETFHRQILNITPEWIEFLEAVAIQAAIAIDNSKLFEDLQRANIELSMAYDATIEGWSRALDLREHESERHSDRVTQMTLNLAQAMYIEPAELVHFRRGALLHDIGKMGIPDHILLKPDKLTEEEWDIMRQHPVLARDLLSSISYLKPALTIPYCHHEKWDGTGYPRGLKKDQIPLAARIFTVADVYDALTSDRPYRSAWSKEKSIDYIRTQSGKHFDPEVVELFLKLNLPTLTMSD